LTTLFDIFAYVSVVLHGLGLVAQTVLVGSIAFVLWVAAPHADVRQTGICATSSGNRHVITWAALMTVIAVIASIVLNAVILRASLGIPWRDVAGAAFVTAGAVRIVAAAITGLVISHRSPLSGGSRVVVAAACALVICASVATSHAVARIEPSGILLLATGLHQLGAALWLGGLPCFWLTLRNEPPAFAARIGRRFSLVAAAGVAMIASAALVFATTYIGAFDAVYGTAYGAMVATKSVLFAILLALGFANFRGVRRMPADSGATRRTARFVEVEMAIGLGVLMAAASITSLPPAVDLAEDRVTLHDIAERMTPVSPRLTSPDHATLAISALQTRLDAEARAAQATSRPQAFVPGAGSPAPRNAYDIAWSEYNHHWAGLLVLTMGLAALARRGGAPWAQHWPLLFLLLAIFLFLRADPEVWPMGEVGFIESLKDPEVAQHRAFEAIIVAFALFEWGVGTGRIVARRLARVFPLLILLSATLLLTHSHALGNVKEELLIELTHLPIAVLGITAGWARWLEVEAPRHEGRWAGWLWPACFIAIGLLLLGYREA
jgi:putative copper resistance protein D